MIGVVPVIDSECYALSEMPRKSRERLWVVAASLAVAASTLVPALLQGLVPVEISDEGAHTFVVIPLFFKALWQGELLKINLADNFGIPVLGDPVSYPWAPHALTYALIGDPVLAMIVNKVWLGTATLVSLFYYFRKRAGAGMAYSCALLSFSSPAFLHHFENHPHQGVLLYFTLALHAIDSLAASPTRGRFAACAAAWLAFLAGVGINGAGLGTPFLLAYGCHRSRARPWLPALAALPALVALHPHFLAVLRLAPLTARVGTPYALTFPTDFWDTLLGLVATVHSSPYQVCYLAQPTAGVLVLTVLGVRALQRSRGDDRALALWLGVVPFACAVALRGLPSVHSAIPYLGATSPLRLLWFSELFMTLAFAQGCRGAIAWGRRVPARGVGVAVLLAAIALQRGHGFWMEAWSVGAKEDITRFNAAEMYPALLSGLRFATDQNPVPAALEAQAAVAGVLGSGGRSILLHRDLRDALVSRGLADVEPGSHAYAILPAAPERLAPLGVRWYLSTNRENRSKLSGWKELPDPPRALRGARLYENPLQPTPVYVAGQAPEFLTGLTVTVNGLRVPLPEGRTAYDVIATFTAWPGWRAWIDGREAAVGEDSVHFLKVRVDSGRWLELRYEPFSGVYLLANLALAAVLALGAASRLGSPRRAPGRAR